MPFSVSPKKSQPASRYVAAGVNADEAEFAPLRTLRSGAGCAMLTAMLTKDTASNLWRRSMRMLAGLMAVLMLVAGCRVSQDGLTAPRARP